MKNRLYYISFIFLVISSCNNWLDVRPRTEVSREDMFSTAAGFKDALTGVYMTLAERGAYGENMTFRVPEMLVQHWAAGKYDQLAEKAMLKYEYNNKDAKAIFDTCYSKIYNAVAGANDILSYLDKNPDVIADDELKQMIRGEALAIRAFCHLDILRMYGPIPLKQDIETTNGLTYVKELTTGGISQVSYSEYCKLLEADLVKSAQILSEVDPLMSYSMEDVNTPNEKGSSFTPLDEYKGYRRVRFNYYAVEALKARFYLYIGQKENALERAIGVLNAKNNDGSPKFKLANVGDYEKQNFTLPSEHLVALSVFDLGEYGNKAFHDGMYDKNDVFIKNQLFGVDAAKDYRYLKGWTNYSASSGAKFNFTNKFIQSDATSSNVNMLEQQVIPLIRLSEVYLIAMECCHITDFALYATDFFRERNLVVPAITEATRQALITNEYQKEFYGEGQMFYMYKRIASNTVLWATKWQLSNYIIPMPDTDIINSK